MLAARLPTVSLVVLLAGCGSPWQLLPPTPAPIPERQAVQVWTDSMMLWHGVRISADTVSGVPYFQDPRCSECRRAVSLAAVDSLRAGPSNESQLATGLAIGLLLSIALAHWLARIWPST